MHEDYHKAARKLDAKLGTPAGATGPVEAEVNTYNSGRVSGLAVGAFAKVSSQIRDLADLVACELRAEYLAFFDIAKKESKGILTQRIRRSLGLAVHRGWSKCFSTGALISPKTHDSRVRARSKQTRTTLKRSNSPT